MRGWHDLSADRFPSYSFKGIFCWSLCFYFFSCQIKSSTFLVNLKKKRIIFIFILLCSSSLPLWGRCISRFCIFFTVSYMPPHLTFLNLEAEGCTCSCREESKVQKQTKEKAYHHWKCSACVAIAGPLSWKAIYNILPKATARTPAHTGVLYCHILSLAFL